MSIDQPIAGPSANAETGIKRPRSPSFAEKSALKKRPSYSVRGDATTRGFFIAFIDNALSQLSRGNSEDYLAIVNVFSPWLRQDLDTNPTKAVSAARATLEPPARMRAWLDALTHAMPRMDASAHSLLIDTALSMTWTAMDETCIGPYVRFVAALLGAMPEYIGLVLKRAVKGLHYRTGMRSSQPSEITRRLAYDRTHRMLQTLVETVPTVPSLLLRQLSVSFPSTREPKEAHVVYFRNALRTIEYCPAFFDDLLNAVIAASLRIDAEIQIEIEDFEDEAGRLDQAVFGVSADPFDSSIGEDAESDVEDGAEEVAFSDISSDIEGQIAEEQLDTVVEKKKSNAPLSPAVVARLQELAAKLDAIMSVLFAFLDREQRQARSMVDKADSPLRTPVETLSDDEVARRRKRLFDVMCLIFERTILSTFKTRHTQFLMFWMLSLDTAFAEQFIMILVNKAFYEGEAVAAVTRVASLCYLASLVSRATFIDADRARSIMGLLSAHIANHLEAVSVDVANAKSVVQQHAVFYAAVQAAFYIFCFRWQNFQLPKTEPTADEDAPKFVPQVDVLRRAVLSPFNPLRICSANVATQFARVAHKVEFMYCFSVIEQNKRMDEAATMAKASSQTEVKPKLVQTPSATPPLVQQALHDARMDSHFPFDPYKLPLSATYLSGIYRHWQDPDPDDADEDDDAVLGTPENGVPIPSAGQLRAGKGFTAGSDDAHLGTSFQAMSLSPQSGQKEAVSMSLVM